VRGSSLLTGGGGSVSTAQGCIRDPSSRRLYGRRQGRRLRPAQQRLVDELLPQLAIDLPGSGRRLDAQSLFAPPPADLWLEIGFGAGEHLAWQAERYPEVGFLGVDYFLNGVAALLRQIERRMLNNIRILRGDGRELLAALPAASLGRVFILFPDPWPKTRHHNRRIIQQNVLDQLARVMKRGAELRLATDDMDYFQWMNAHFRAHSDFEWHSAWPAVERELTDHWPQTRYEAKALKLGHRPIHLRVLRKGDR
jgi:tRNA (guanine-N7-)-methyltransferase